MGNKLIQTLQVASLGGDGIIPLLLQKAVDLISKYLVQFFLPSEPAYIPIIGSDKSY